MDCNQNEYCKDIIIANCYRPPSGTIDNFIKILEFRLNQIDLSKNDVFVIGDLNIDFSITTCNNVKKLKSMLEQLGFIQIIKKPTRYSKIKIV